MKKYSKYTKEEIENSVNNSHSLSESMRKMGLIPRGRNYMRFRSMVKYFKIDTSHFNQKHSVHLLKRHSVESFKKEVLKKNGKRWVSTAIKVKIFKYELLKEECVECGIGSTWKRKKLVLHLDHIDGDYRNNEIENLRILCPNCHSQTETYCNKGSRSSKKDAC